ncbi:MAG: endolytic transglycosylase MltG [Lachnospiraceae bacterium]|nr:endolytic transglycosylase MltG [Lachnospiraceae bacterium]
MNIKYIIGSIVEMVIKITAFVFIAMFVIRTAAAAHDYGFRVFAEKPMDVGEGRTISVSIGNADSAKEVGEMLQERGLIRDATLFRIQELLSENHGKIRPGIYDLTTAMTAQEMLEVIAAKPDEEEESKE